MELPEEETTLCDSPAAGTDWKVVPLSASICALETRLALFGKIVRSESFK